MSNIVQIKVPDIGDFKEVEVIEVLVSVGDTIKAEQSLITVESDKASMEIPTSQGGVVKSISVKVGDKVAEGTVVLEVEAAGAAAPAAPAAAPAAAAPAKAAEAAKPAAAAAPAPAASAGPVEIQVPDIGDFKEVEVIEVMVAVGDTIKAEQSLITVESDKASMEIPTRRAAWSGSEGQGRRQGRQGLGRGRGGRLGSGRRRARPGRCRRARAQAEAPAPAAPAAAPAARPAPAAALEDANLKPGQLPHASPSVRKFARELGVNLSKVKGSGPKDRITADDVRAFVKQALAAPAAVAGGSADGAALGLLPWPKVDFTKFGPIEAAAVAHQEDLRREPASQLGHDPARHQQ